MSTFNVFKMKSYVVLVIAIVLTFIPSIQSTDNSIVYEREVTLYSTGLILLEDRISGLSGIEKTLTLRFPRNITDNLLDYRAEAANGLNLNLSIARYMENETIIEIPGFISPSLRLLFLINGSALIGTEPFTIYLPIYPGLNTYIAKLNFTVVAPDIAEFRNYPSDFNKSANKIWLICRDLEPNAFRLERITIANSPLIIIEAYNKTITISEFGDVIVEDFYRILNIGSTIPQIDFNLPIDVCEVNARDEFGRLQISMKTGGNVLKLSVKPRYDLRKNDRYSLVISYKFPAGTLANHSLFKTSHKLSIELKTALPIVVKVLHVNLKMPSYSEIVSVKPENFTMKNNIVSFTLRDNQTPLLSPIRPQFTLTIEYDYNVLWSSLQPILWSICGLITITIVYYVCKVQIQKTVEIVSKAKPLTAAKEIKEFISAYEEKLNLRRELRNLENEYLARNISKNEFLTRSTKIKNRIAEIDKIIENLKPAVRHAGFSDELIAIEEAETDLNICDVGLSELRNRYKTGKVSKYVYERLLNEYNKRIRNNENKIRRCIESISSG